MNNVVLMSRPVAYQARDDVHSLPALVAVVVEVDVVPPDVVVDGDVVPPVVVEVVLPPVVVVEALMHTGSMELHWFWIVPMTPHVAPGTTTVGSVSSQLLPTPPISILPHSLTLTLTILPVPSTVAPLLIAPAMLSVLLVPSTIISVTSPPATDTPLLVPPTSDKAT